MTDRNTASTVMHRAASAASGPLLVVGFFLGITLCLFAPAIGATAGIYVAAQIHQAYGIAPNALALIGFGGAGIGLLPLWALVRALEPV